MPPRRSAIATLTDNDCRGVPCNSPRSLYRFRASVGRHQPLDALARESDLQPAVLAAALQIDDGAFAKLGVAHALAQLVAGIVLTDRRAHAAVIDRARYAGAQAHFFHALFRQLADKARRPVVNLFAVQTARFGIGQR